MLRDDRYRAYELSLKAVSELFEWWERAAGTISSSAVTDQQTDAADEGRHTSVKKAKKPAGCLSDLSAVLVFAQCYALVSINELVHQTQLVASC